MRWCETNGKYAQATILRLKGVCPDVPVCRRLKGWDIWYILSLMVIPDLENIHPYVSVANVRAGTLRNNNVPNGIQSICSFSPWASHMPHKSAKLHQWCCGMQGRRTKKALCEPKKAVCEPLVVRHDPTICDLKNYSRIRWNTWSNDGATALFLMTTHDVEKCAGKEKRAPWCHSVQETQRRVPWCHCVQETQRRKIIVRASK